MKTFLGELLKYTHYSNQVLAELIILNEKQVTQKSIILFSHLISAHQIWNCRILQKQKPFAVWQLHPILDLQKIDTRNYQNSKNIISNFELDSNICYQTSKGTPFKNTVKDILFQVINHSTCREHK